MTGFMDRIQEPFPDTDSESGFSIVDFHLANYWVRGLSPPEIAFTVVTGPAHAPRDARGIQFFSGGCFCLGGFLGCLLRTGLLSACLAVFDPRGFP